MSINFTNAAPGGQNVPELKLGAPEPGIAEPEPYDIQADRENLTRELAHSPEIDALTSAIDVSDLNTIVTFGAHSAEEISKSSDVILRSLNMSDLDDSSELLGALSKVMDQFDLDEVRSNPSLFEKLFGNLRKSLEKIIAKYQTMGDEVDKIYVQLRQYEDEIKRSNIKLDQLFDANVGYYHELVKYIVAGEQGVREITDYMNQRADELRQSGDPSITFEVQTLQQARDMLAQRVQDLRTAEIVAMQSIPMIRTMQFSNMNLVRKINSAFIITLPVFKQALAQAILLKRQQIQAEAISALDARTNEMLLKNAKNTAETSKLTAKLANGSSVRADTLESTWRTIISGIDETKKVQESAIRQRKEDQEKLEHLKSEFHQKFDMPDKP